MTDEALHVGVIGGGAAGFFAAIAAAEQGHRVTIFEANKDVLAKVRISGGGRCNVTHHCFDPRELVKAYPRGGKALRGPLSRFQPADTVDWFANRGVPTKTEEDGRMFPTTDDSETIVTCLTSSALDANVRIRTQTKVKRIEKIDEKFLLHLGDAEAISVERILLATGGSRNGFELARTLGHEIVAPVPSLFTFVVQDERIAALPGIVASHAECELCCREKSFKQTGPVLITHWGLSGPAVLKLSAWAARELHDSAYRANLKINWLPDMKEQQLTDTLNRQREESPKKAIASSNPTTLPKRLWKSLAIPLVGEEMRWADLSKKLGRKLAHELQNSHFQVQGKGQFKDEFVTCGGVKLDEVDFRSMESRICRGVYFAGEILDIDGITGGFNFQNAWTTAWIAGNAL